MPPCGSGAGAIGGGSQRRSRQPRSQRSTNPAAASPPRQRITVSKSTPAAMAIRAGLYRFKTYRMVFELGIHEISYAAW
jgi:hypothetical protein